MEGQNWNNVLEYIKLFLGVPVNLLEFRDDELIGYFKAHVLTLFSQYSPAKKYAYISGSNLMSFESATPRFRYKIPIDPGVYIVDILEAYPTAGIEVVDAYAGIVIDAQSAMDLVISNSYIDAIRSLQPRNTWEFQQPDIIIFDQEITASVIVYNTVHTVLNTINPDLYHKAFKPLCLAFTKIWVAAMRSKFEGLNTPVGQLNLNFDKLQTEGETLRDNTLQMLEQIPPDLLIHVS